METINLDNLTAEQLDALSKQALKAKREKEQQTRHERKAYKLLASDLVTEAIPELLAVSEQLIRVKKKVYDNFATAIKIKRELYNTKEIQYSDTFSNIGGCFKITLGERITDGYDDTVNEGIEIVREYISSLASDEKTQQLVGLVMQLLSRNREGHLNARRIVQLRKLADKSGNERFIDGVKIIHDAYCPQQSKKFITAEHKDEQGVWHSIPLSATEA